MKRKLFIFTLITFVLLVCDILSFIFIKQNVFTAISLVLSIALFVVVGVAYCKERKKG